MLLYFDIGYTLCVVFLCIYISYERRDKMKKMLLIIGLALSFFLFTGCNVTTLDTERLLGLPLLNEKDADILALFEEALNNKTMQFVYPQNGEIRSPVLPIKIKGSTDEAFICFMRSQSGDDGIVACLLIDKNGQYSFLKAAVLEGQSILKSVYLEDINGDSYKEIIVFCENSEGVKIAIILGANKDGLEKLFQKEYNKASLSVVEGDMPRLFLANKSAGKKTVITMVYEGVNNTVKINTLSVRTGEEELSSLKAGLAAPEKPGLFVECFDGGQTVTRVVLWDAGSMSAEMTADSGNIPERQTSKNCEDINGDGVLEIPFEAVDYYKTGTGQSPADSVRIYQWHMWNEKGISSEQKTVRLENSRYRYSFTFPESIIGKVVMDRTVKNEIAFYTRWDKEPAELFTITSMERSVFDTRTPLEKLTLLAEDGTMVHALRLPEERLPDDARAILPTVEQLKNAFDVYINTEVTLP